jgi:hypothetical protein
MIRTAKYNVEIEFIEPILGSLPADPAVYTNYIASKAPSTWQHDEEVELADARADEMNLDKGITVFARDEKGLFLYNYHVKGFLKEVANMLKDNFGIPNLRSKIDYYVYVQPRRIYLTRPNGRIIQEEDEIFERPLRAKTAQGERVALAASERINPPCKIQFTLEIVENSAGITWELLQEICKFGRLKGLGQWRNGGWGQFELKTFELAPGSKHLEPIEKVSGNKKKAEESEGEEKKRRGRKKKEESAA